MEKRCQEPNSPPLASFKVPDTFFLTFSLTIVTPSVGNIVELVLFHLIKFRILDLPNF